MQGKPFEIPPVALPAPDSSSSTLIVGLFLLFLVPGCYSLSGPPMESSVSALNGDMELRTVALESPLNRSLAKDPDAKYTEAVVEVAGGCKVTVARAGDPSRPAVLTYHDLGLNYVSNFQAFFNYPEMREILQRFCVYHVNAPGQEDGAEAFKEDFEYPTMDVLAEQVGPFSSMYNWPLLSSSSFHHVPLSIVYSIGGFSSSTKLFLTRFYIASLLNFEDGNIFATAFHHQTCTLKQFIFHLGQ